MHSPTGVHLTKNSL